MTKNRPTITCADCGEQGRNHGRGLCSSCHHRNYRNGTLHLFPTIPRGTPKRRPSRRCEDCGRIHRGKYAECQDCRLLPIEVTDEHALTGGRWVLDRMTWVYVYDQEDAA